LAARFLVRRVLGRPLVAVARTPASRHPRQDGGDRLRYSGLGALSYVLKGVVVTLASLE
jgi:hypothetical protein